MRKFELVRTEDLTGISGTGTVAQGVEFDDGTCVMRWCTKLSSTAIYSNARELVDIHGHEGRTTLRYIEDGSE
jgi:hypothetical protein